MLHEILEKLPLDQTAQAEDLERWRSLAAVVELIDWAMDHHGIHQSYRDEVEDVVYRAFTFKVPLDDGRTIDGLCHCVRSLREMEFLFPFPEVFHPPLTDPRPGKFTIGRGFIKGFVDLVVEHEGRTYFGDWKSDVLASYSGESLEQHVAEHYSLQAKLYAMALVKALSIHTESDYEQSFGGLFYIFLRGLRPAGRGAPGTGVYFDRPTWAQILSYEEEIKRFATTPGGVRP